MDSDSVLVENLRFQGALFHALRFNRGSGEVRNCEFVGNGTHPQNYEGALHIDGWATVLVEDCYFGGNAAGFESSGLGGAIYSGRWMTVRNCVFEGNYASGQGGAIFTWEYSVIEDCIFVGNSARNGAAVTMGYRVDLRRCTFYRNEVLGPFGGAVEVFEQWSYPEQCIFAETIGGSGIMCSGLSEVRCCAFWGNEYGPGNEWYCGIFRDECVFEDPLFCNAGEGDFGLRPESPCLPENHGIPGCGVMGAEGAGCVTGVWNPMQTRVPTGSLQLSPNPVVRELRISWVGDDELPLSWAVFDVGGRCIAESSKFTLDGGVAVAEWDGLGKGGHRVPSGVYFLQVRTRDGVSTKTLVLIE